MVRATAQIAYVLGLCLVLAAGCSSVASDLHSAQSLYKDARYEEAQEWLSELEHEAGSMTKDELAQFHYLRGMTAFRLGQREDALHYLALADALVAEDARRLPPDFRPVLQRALEDVTPVGASPHPANAPQPDAR